MRRFLCAFLVISFFASKGDAGSVREWDGPYVGASLNFSGAVTTILGNRFTYNQNQAVNLAEHDYNGRALSGFTGWNWQHGKIVFGGEVSLGIGGLSSDLVFNSDSDIDQVEIDWTGALAGRMGYVSNNSLFYLKAGISFC